MMYQRYDKERGISHPVGVPVSREDMLADLQWHSSNGASVNFETRTIQLGDVTATFEPVQ